MGIEWHTARFLVGARKSGVNFTRTATLGRQNLFASPQEIGSFFNEYGVSPLIDHVMTSSSEFADDLFKALGATTYVPIDASPYEGAVEVHDMNVPIPDHLRGAFDAVLDGGTLEHVFSFPTAVRNCMEMVRVGGHLLIQTPANNFCGHGFYQFSPELYYRVLSSENGFVVERMLACEACNGSRWYEVTDPAQVKARVELIGSRQRVLLLIRARRTHEATIFAKWPQQSDYVEAWSQGRGLEFTKPGGEYGIRTQPGFAHRLIRRTLRLVGLSDQRSNLEWYTSYLNKQLGLSAQPDVFRPVDK